MEKVVIVGLALKQENKKNIYNSLDELELLVKTANRFNSNITIEKDGIEVNGKSIMGVLMLAASKGTKITLKIEGEDEKEAMKILGELFENKFGEE